MRTERGRHGLRGDQVRLLDEIAAKGNPALMSQPTSTHGTENHMRLVLTLAALLGLGCIMYTADAAHAATRHDHKYHAHRHHVRKHHARHSTWHVPALVKHPRPIHVWSTRVLGHAVRAAAYRPGDHYRMVVGASRHSVHTVPHWANAQHASTKTVAAINGNTWIWRTLQPVGTVRTHGHFVSHISNVPAVGFKANGGMVFGARSARKAGAMNIIPGKAYLLKGGRVQHTFPWAAPAQRTCNAPHTDGGYGCWRSVEARWNDGRVGLVEIAYANMAQAAHVLKAMHVHDALTGDSGGSPNFWTRQGSGGCSRMSNGHVFGSCFGPLHHAGLPYERAVPNVAMIVKV